MTRGVLIGLAIAGIFQAAAAEAQVPSATGGLHPNLAGHIDQPLRYHPEGPDFVIHNGQEFFNRSLYGGHTAFRVDGGDKPEFMLYLPGRGGNLRLGVRTAAGVIWLKDAADIVTRYRPGELIYAVRDPVLGEGAVVTIEVLAYDRTEGLIVRTTAQGVDKGAELIWAYGGVNGQRGMRDGDIGTEKVPISDYFQFQPDFATGNDIHMTAQGFTLKSTRATLSGVMPAGAVSSVGDGDTWNNLTALLTLPTTPPKHPVVVGHAPLPNDQPLYLSLQRVADGTAQAPEPDTYREVTTSQTDRARGAPRPVLAKAFDVSQLPELFAATQKHFDDLRTKVTIETPDPYLNAAMGALNVAADALWDDRQQALMHGAIAWRTKLVGWRGPYALDDLGWHDRARQNFKTWTAGQNLDPIPAILPSADDKTNLSRNEAGLHSNGDLSHSHYDMNLVFIDALFRHLLWTGDKTYARQVWPVIQRHLAWEQRLFRRTYGPDHLPLYEAYAVIWASDDLYYDGGGTSYASAYNLYGNRMAARIAAMIGADSTPYAREADLIDKAMHAYLWLPQGAFAESKDLLGRQSLHDDYALWSFYHSVDEGAATPREAWAMGNDLSTHLTPIPVTGPDVPDDRPYHVLSESDWMPYTWSINNVVMDENLHTALGLWQGGHADDAYVLAKAAVLASLYMGISPGNVGSMDYLDAYRRESQRDFGDAAGTLSRAVVEGLFGIQPDALAGTLTIAPGFPESWQHARLSHPDIGLDFKRLDRVDHWMIIQTAARFKTVTLRIPLAFSGVKSVKVQGANVRWHIDREVAARPVVEMTTRAGRTTAVVITWSGQAGVTAIAPTAKSVTPAAETINWTTPIAGLAQDSVDLSAAFNDKVTEIFKPSKYLSPRSPYVSLSLPSQGVGAWAGHVNTLPVIDDSGLRQVAAAHGGRVILPDGIAFATPAAADARNIAFASQWDNYPREITVPLSGQAKALYLLMAGSTNAMQSHMDNGEVVVTYTDGTTQRLALRNPETWWPIEQDYFIDDYQFPDTAPLPPRVDLKTGTVRVLDPVAFKGQGRDVPGGAATVLHLKLDPAKTLAKLTVRALSNDVVIGLMSATLERP